MTDLENNSRMSLPHIDGASSTGTVKKYSGQDKGINLDGRNIASAEMPPFQSHN